MSHCNRSRQNRSRNYHQNRLRLVRAVGVIGSGIILGVAALTGPGIVYVFSIGVYHIAVGLKVTSRRSVLVESFTLTGHNFFKAGLEIGKCKGIISKDCSYFML